MELQFSAQGSSHYLIGTDGSADCGWATAVADHWLMCLQEEQPQATSGAQLPVGPPSCGEAQAHCHLEVCRPQHSRQQLTSLGLVIQCSRVLLPWKCVAIEDAGACNMLHCQSLSGEDVLFPCFEVKHWEFAIKKALRRGHLQGFQGADPLAIIALLLTELRTWQQLLHSAGLKVASLLSVHPSKRAWSFVFPNSQDVE